MKYNQPEVLVLEPAMTAVESLVKWIPLVFEIGSPLIFALQPAAYEADE